MALLLACALFGGLPSGGALHQPRGGEEAAAETDSQQRLLPHTGSVRLRADRIFETSTGSFWLPEPPVPDAAAVLSSPECAGCPRVAGCAGFMTDGYVRLMMAQGFNAGDFLAYFVAPLIAGRVAALPNSRCSITVVGSILGWGTLYNWGPGFMTEDEGEDYAFKAGMHYYAVRGPVSRLQLRQRWIAQSEPSGRDATAFPPVFGDSGSLLAWFYQPHDQSKDYDLCLLPHLNDEGKIEDLAWRWASDDVRPGLRILSMRWPLFDIIDELVHCRFVFSSSLHGLIFSDSYGVPNAHIRLSEKGVDGGNYKFEDYFSSVGRRHSVYNWTGDGPETRKQAEQDAEAEKALYAPSIDLLPFWRACPLHAEMHNRTRREHRRWAASFVSTLVESLRSAAGGVLQRPLEAYDSSFWDFHVRVTSALSSNASFLSDQALNAPPGTSPPA